MATSKIKKDLLIMDVPYSDFTWNSSSKQFISSAVTAPTGKTLLGILVTALSSTVILAGRENGLHQIQIGGWNPSGGSALGGTETFICKLIYQ